MGILISNKNVDQGLVVESTKPEYLPPLALFCWCGYRCVSLAVSLLCLVPGAGRAARPVGWGAVKPRGCSTSP